MSTALSNMAGKLAERLGMDAGTDLMNTLKLTAFKGGNVTDEQFTALLIVANQYELNPWTKEIYAFPDKGGIVPVVGVDGWARIINGNPNFDGMEFEQDNESCTCKIYRKDRTHPTTVTEFMSECKRTTQPWNSHPKRMLRHKAMIQCARLAFGFAGIFDTDEAERIIEGTPAEVHVGRESNGQRPNLISAAETEAKRGMEAFKSHWLSLTNEQREIIGIVEKKRLYELSLKSESAEEAEFTEAE